MMIITLLLQMGDWGGGGVAMLKDRQNLTGVNLFVCPENEIKENEIKNRYCLSISTV